MNHNLNKRWDIASKIPPEIDQELSDYTPHPVLRQLLFNRGITDAVDAFNFLTREGPMFDPFLMTGMEQAVDRLLNAIDRGEKIVVYGDFYFDLF